MRGGVAPVYNNDHNVRSTIHAEILNFKNEQQNLPRLLWFGKFSTPEQASWIPPHRLAEAFWIL